MNGNFFGLRFLEPYYCVQAFFVISGFYMGLVLTEKYSFSFSGLSAFYINRYLRLAPSFWFITFASIVAATYLPDDSLVDRVFQGKVEFVCWTNGFNVTLIALSNLFIVGHDLIEFVGYTLPSGQCQLFAVIPQAWSIGVELWFYLLAPWLVRLPNRWLFACAGALLTARLTAIAMRLPFWPWQQRFVVFEAFFFILGILAYRLYSFLRRHKQLRYQAANRFILAIAWSAVMLVGWLPASRELHVWNSLLVGLSVLLIVPFVYDYTKKWAIDRFLGELSYPIYLSHVLVLNSSEIAQTSGKGSVALLLTVMLSTLIVIFIERPVDRWRQQLLSFDVGITATNTSGVRLAA